MNYWENITEIYNKQREKGIREYGQTIEQNQSPDIVERLSYMEEELVDALVYLEWIKDKTEKIGCSECEGDIFGHFLFDMLSMAESNWTPSQVKQLKWLVGAVLNGEDYAEHVERSMKKGESLYENGEVNLSIDDGK